MKRFTLLAGVLLAVLVACGGEEKDVTLESVGGDAAPPESEQSPASTAVSIDGALLLVKGASLYYFDPSSGAAPQLIASDIDPLTISLAPSRDRVIFDTPNSSDGQARILNLPTLEPEVLPTVISHPAASSWGVASWSPNEQWVISFSFPRGIEAVNVNGPGGFQLARDTDAFATWLTDGNILVVDRDFHQTQVVYKGVFHFDLNTGESEEWPANEADLDADFQGTVTQLVAEHGLDLAGEVFATDSSVRIAAPEDVFSFNSAATVCGAWSLTRPTAAAPTIAFAPDFQPEILAVDTQPEIFYQAEGVHRLSDAVMLNDGNTILFLEWTLPDCRVSETPAITLKRLVIGDTPETVAEGVSSEISYSFREQFQAFSARYALSPDQRYVVWAGGNADAGKTSVNLTDLATGETVTLLAEEHSGLDAYAFNANQLFRRVYWVTQR